MGLKWNTYAIHHYIGIPHWELCLKTASTAGEILRPIWIGGQNELNYELYNSWITINSGGRKSQLVGS